MERIISLNDILTMDRISRLNFFNGISGFKSAMLVGTQNKEGQKNLTIFNSIVHIGSNPPYLGMVIRPHTVPRHTYENILATGFYTLNQVNASSFKQAHQTSAKYDVSVSEFETCGFTPQYSENHAAPYVEECSIKFGMQFEEAHSIKANDTIFVVGKVLEILLPENAILPSGHVNQEEWDSIAVAGLDTYYKVNLLDRLPYAKP